MTDPMFMLRLDVSQPLNSKSNNIGINNSVNNRNYCGTKNPLYNYSTNNDSNTDNDSDNNSLHSATTRLSGLISYNLEADYSNMRRLQTKLQEALTELDSVHCQRIMRYIS